MAVKNYLDTQPLHDIMRYKSHVDIEKEAVAFIGAPRAHPYDEEKMLLIKEPFSADTLFYEFNVSDILQVDDMPSLGTDSGRNVNMARIWVKKGSLGMRIEPFEVDTPLKFLKDSEILQQVVSS